MTSQAGEMAPGPQMVGRSQHLSLSACPLPMVDLQPAHSVPSPDDSDPPIQPGCWQMYLITAEHTEYRPLNHPKHTALAGALGTIAAQCGITAIRIAFSSSLPETLSPLNANAPRSPALTVLLSVP